MDNRPLAKGIPAIDKLYSPAIETSLASAPGKQTTDVNAASPSADASFEMGVILGLALRPVLPRDDTSNVFINRSAILSGLCFTPAFQTVLPEMVNIEHAILFWDTDSFRQTTGHQNRFCPFERVAVKHGEYRPIFRLYSVRAVKKLRLPRTV